MTHFDPPLFSRLAVSCPPARPGRERHLIFSRSGGQPDTPDRERQADRDIETAQFLGPLIFALLLFAVGVTVWFLS